MLCHSTALVLSNLLRNSETVRDNRNYEELPTFESVPIHFYTGQDDEISNVIESRAIAGQLVQLKICLYVLTVKTDSGDPSSYFVFHHPLCAIWFLLVMMVYLLWAKNLEEVIIIALT